MHNVDVTTRERQIPDSYLTHIQPAYCVRGPASKVFFAIRSQFFAENKGFTQTDQPILATLEPILTANEPQSKPERSQIGPRLSALTAPSVRASARVLHHWEINGTGPESGLSLC